MCGRKGILIALPLLAVFSAAELLGQTCCTANETILSADGTDLSSSKYGQFGTLVCSVGQQVTLHVRTVYVQSPLGCSGGQLPCGTADAIVVEWKNWYPNIINVNNSGSSTTTAACLSTGEITIGVKVEERHQACTVQGCQSLSPAFPVVTAPAQVQ